MTYRYGGEGGIRTHEPTPRALSAIKGRPRLAAFEATTQSQGQISFRGRKVAERVGFEPMLFKRCLRLLAFASVPPFNFLKLFKLSTCKPL